jgi:hypothetical protein
MNAPTTLAGPTLKETWAQVERTRAAVSAALARGEIAVANTRHALPLLEQLGVSSDQRSKFYEPEREKACDYCTVSALCGRAWEELQ